MLFIILLIALVIWITVSCIKSGDGWFEIICTSVIGFLILEVIFVIGSLFISDKTETFIESTKIVALEDQYFLDGNVKTFLLASSGSINEELKYTVLQNSSNGIVTRTYDSNKVYLRYDENPRIENTYIKIDDPDWWRTWINMLDPRTEATTLYSTTIYIPSGTIKTDYNIDLQK